MSNQEMSSEFNESYKRDLLKNRLMGKKSKSSGRRCATQEKDGVLLQDKVFFEIQEWRLRSDFDLVIFAFDHVLVIDHERNLCVYDVSEDSFSSPVGTIIGCQGVLRILVHTPGGFDVYFKTKCGVTIKESDLIIQDHELSFRETE